MTQMESPAVRNALITALLSGFVLLAPGAVRADTRYQVQMIARGDQPVGDVTNGSEQLFQIGDLNDRGHVALVTGDLATEIDLGGALVQYADGQWTTIARHGRPGAPQGTWPTPIYIGPPKMNQNGDFVFVTAAKINSPQETGTYRWDFARRTVTPVVTKGTPAANNLTFENGGFLLPVINNRGEIAFPAAVKNAVGKAAHGIFFQGQDGKVQSVVLPDQEIAGSKVEQALRPSINDAGVVGFLTFPLELSDAPTGAYLWEQGTITPVALAGATTTSGEKILEVWDIRVNDRNRTALVELRVEGKDDRGLYRYTDGKLTALVVVGQDMPGGGKLADTLEVSWANGEGQHAFYAALEDGSPGAYLLDAQGTLSLIVKSGASTNVGTITQIAPGASSGIALNSTGQVALPVQIENGPAAVALFTPVAP